jgi:hypothetical protein
MSYLLRFAQQFSEFNWQPLSLLALLGLGLVATGTAFAIKMFRSSNSLLPLPGPYWKRLSPVARKAAIFLGLGFAVVGVVSLLTQVFGMFLCLMLLTLGIVTGLAALAVRSERGKEEGPTRLGISQRAWVSLTLLTMSGATLVAQDFRALRLSNHGLAGAANHSAGSNPNKTNPTVWTAPMAPASKPGKSPYPVEDLTYGLQRKP